MANKTGTYDFSKCVLLIKHPKYEGIIMIDGFAPDTTINVARPEQRWTLNPSGDGKATTVVRNPNNAGTISFTLNQSTDSLGKMNAIAEHGNISDGDDLLFEVTVADKSSGSIHYSRDAIVGDPESVEYGPSENGREFQIQCGSLTSTLAGSAKISKDTLAFIQAMGFNVDASRVADF